MVWDTDSRYAKKIDSATLLRHGNDINGLIEWESSIYDKTVPKSYYLKSKPDFYGSLNWPSTGADLLGGTNPARERYLGNTIPDEKIKCGDINGDGSVNSIDFGYLRMYLLGMIKEFPAENGFVAADVNGDGNVNSIDFGLMRQYLMGMIKKFPAEV